MNTLTIPEIFSNFSYYQENYLTILKKPQQYHIEVAQAYLHVWPLSEKKLYLGDLLQLWFSEKWLINSACQLLSTTEAQSSKKQIHKTQDLYLFQLTGSTFSGVNHSKVWSVSEQKELHVSLDSVFKYLCYFESIERPAFNQQDDQKTFKKVI